DGEIGLNKLEDSKGKTIHLSYMTGARAQVVIKLSQRDGALILERPKLREWTLYVGKIQVPPDNYAQLKLVRATEAQDDIVAQLKRLPDVSQKNYKTEPYVLAAARLQKLTKDKACEAMMAVADDWEHEIIVLCRLLFTAKEGGEFRNPLVGAASYLGDTGDK